MWAVIKKEIKSYFYSPVGYVFIGLFLIMLVYFSIQMYLHIKVQILNIYFIQEQQY